MQELSIDSNKESTNEREDRYLQFDLGSECYAIQLLSVKEVIPVPETTPLPNSPSHYRGIMNLRGQIISIVDLRKKLKITSKTEGLEEAVIIVDFEGIGIGLIVDSINNVLNISISQIAEIPEVQSQVNARYILGVYKSSEKLTILLDMAGILNIEEIQAMRNKAA